MTTIAILPDSPGEIGTAYRAVAGSRQATGRTAGEALDALTNQLDEAERGTLVVVQNLRPDHFFTAPQQQRMEHLMARWRAARDVGGSLEENEQAELDGLVQAELEGATSRAAALLHEMEP